MFDVAAKFVIIKAADGAEITASWKCILAQFGWVG